MKKKLLFVFFGFIIIVFTISLLKTGDEAKMETGNSETVTEQNRPLNDLEPSSEGMIWESLSRHFMTVN